MAHVSKPFLTPAAMTMLIESRLDINQLGPISWWKRERQENTEASIRCFAPSTQIAACWNRLGICNRQKRGKFIQNQEMVS